MGVQSKLVKLWLLLLLAHRYHVEGIVVEAKPGERQITIAHRPIENYMPAMTMTFHAGRAVSFEKLTPGTRVAFDLKVGKSSSVAENLQIQSVPDVGFVFSKLHALEIGQRFPDFSLTDQTGKEVNLAGLRGRIVVLDFIYTRCPLPDVCPRLSANFASASKKLRGRDVEFLSITIDPQHDTPEVLAEYAKRWQAGDSWRFLTGTPSQIQDVAGLFGLVYWPEEGSITHTVATAIIGRDGTLVAKIDGAGYRPDQLLALIDHALE